MTTTTLTPTQARDAHGQARDVVQVPEDLVRDVPAASVLRQLLLQSCPFASASCWCAVVDLLHGAGLLGDARFVEACVVLDDDVEDDDLEDGDAEVAVAAELDLYAVAVAARGEHAEVQLPGPVARLLAVVVLLSDLDAELHQLPAEPGALAIRAVRALACDGLACDGLACDGLALDGLIDAGAPAGGVR